MNDRKEKLTFWLTAASYYQKRLPDFILAMYADDCKECTAAELKWAFEQYRRGPQKAFFPLPGALLDLINPAVDENAEANMVPAIIYTAIRKFGYTQRDEAKNFMGSFAWSCVEDFGGWSSLCRSTESETILRAQIRDLAKSKIIREQQRRSDKLPELSVLKKIENTALKEIE